MTTFGIPILSPLMYLEYEIFKAHGLRKSLESFGFSNIKCHNALASTGFTGTSQAADWLIKHSLDPDIDKDALQTYYFSLTLCGQTKEQIEEFWYSSLSNEGWNAAHDFFPNINIFPAFKVPNKFAIKLHDIFLNLAKWTDKHFEGIQIKLNLRAFDDFIGYFVSNSDVESLLDDLSSKISSELNAEGLLTDCNLIDRQKTNFFVSVAYGFPPLQRDVLIQLSETVLPKSADETMFKLELYSFNCRLLLPDTELYEMQTTLSIDNHFFEKLSLSNYQNGSYIPTRFGRSHSLQLSNKTLTNCEAGIKSMSPPENQPGDISSVGNQCRTLIQSSVSISHSMSVHSSTTLNEPFNKRLLPHNRGDLVLLLGSVDLHEMLGCAFGFNMSTGQSGAFNLEAITRVAKTKAWVLHKSYSLKKDCHILQPIYVASSLSTQSELLTPASVLRIRASSIGILPDSCFTCDPALTIGESTRCSSDSVNDTTLTPSQSTEGCKDENGKITAAVSADQAARQCLSPTIFNTLFSTLFGAIGANTKISQRRLFVMRHGERVDLCFGHAWTTTCLDKLGVYRRYNLNLPKYLLPRDDPLDLIFDSPLTQIGLFSAAETGRALADSGIRFSVCYSSPSLRCVQTATALLSSMEQLAIRIEPLLFEWLGWYRNRIPLFLTPQQLRQHGYHVDVDYSPAFPQHALNIQESVQQYHERSTQLIRSILSKHTDRDATILVVAHATSLDACTHGLVHKRFRSSCFGANAVEDLHKRSASVPYCGLVMAVEGRRWHLQQPPVPPLSYNCNPHFDWRHLLH